MFKDELGNTRFAGIYRAVVVDNNDPLGKGRLRLKIPQIIGDQVTGWCWGVFPSATVQIPAINDGIWVMFEGGDPSYPTWLGTFTPATPVRWSPEFSATNMAFTGTGATYPTYNSYYIKNGQLVTFNIKILMSTVTNFGTGQYKTELPFLPISSAANHFSAWAWVDPTQPPDELNGHVQLVADHLPNTKVLDLHWLKETTASPKPVIESQLIQGTPITFTTASFIYINGTYISAE